MNKPKSGSSEDYFEGTKMTFGEHIEELRVALVKGLLGLTVGMLVGLYYANDVVLFIEKPLLAALEKHYGDLAIERLKRQYEVGDAKDLPPEVAKVARSFGFVFEEAYFEREQLERLLAHARQAEDETPPAGGQVTSSDRETAAPAASPEAIINEPLGVPTMNLIKTRFWTPANVRITSLSPHETFMIWMKAGFVFGLLVASPYIFYQIWHFVAAGLYPHERSYVHIYLPFSLLLFLAGAALAFFFVFGPVLDFLFGFSRAMNIDPDLRISEVISFVLILPLGFGISFQLPLVMLFINRIGIVDVRTFLEKWRIAILTIFVVSMILTPADPISMLLMALPLVVLYFLGVGLCVWMPRGRNPFTDAYEP